VLKIKLIFLSLFIFSLLSFLYAKEEIKGLVMGDKTSSFTVYDVTGPNKGKELCYV